MTYPLMGHLSYPIWFRAPAANATDANAGENTFYTNLLPLLQPSTANKAEPLVGFLAKVDLNMEHLINEKQNMTIFENPKVKTNQHVQGRSWLSLLSGMTPSPMKEAAASEPSDLMTWHSSEPEPRRASSYGASSLATPVHRPHRLNKIKQVGETQTLILWPIVTKASDWFEFCLKLDWTLPFFLKCI